LTNPLCNQELIASISRVAFDHITVAQIK